ncbi:ATP-dependent helicase C-terminal domain-containing protein [Reinekea blandensis]|uniref:ATP-dependent helicase C-terminal domain-containing protein n=1 Tax=Reinekea blandensis TaxID=374838 RepID=UPI000307399F|nr:ATP-dependent helicase C-terminal domain-containing protein [Reinekea blandensis]
MAEHDLPIAAIRNPVLNAWNEHGGAIISAPPGSGKTTQLPLWFLDSGEAPIFLLIPKRLAVRMAARQLSDQLAEPVGQRVGYQLRDDAKTSASTRLVVTTYGTFLRILLNDPDRISGSTVIFDEFHERSVDQDLSFALIHQYINELDDSVRRLIMSATLNIRELATQTGLPVIESDGRSYPVKLTYQPTNIKQPADIARVIRNEYQHVEHHILVFLPGIREIRAIERHLDMPVLILHGTLNATPDVQALSQAPATVILATNVAESSITLPSVHTVIDTGLERYAQVHPVTGLTELKTRRISQASATQRSGRAGRLGPGKGIRLWSEDDQQSLVPHLPPPVRESDLTESVLLIAGWGNRPAEIPWPETPPKQRLALAVEKLTTWGALSADGHITPHGRAMLRLGLPPWLAHLLALAQTENRLTAAALLAAHIGKGLMPAYDFTQPQTLSDFSDDIRKETIRLISRFQLEPNSTIEPISESLLVRALSDRVIRFHGKNDGQMISGTRVQTQVPSSSEWALLIDGIRREQHILGFAWVAVSGKAVLETLPIETDVLFQPTQKAAFLRRRRLGRLNLDETPYQPEPEEKIQAWSHHIDAFGEEALSWSAEDRAFKRRCQVAEALLDDWPKWPDGSEWTDLAMPFLNGLKRLDDLVLSPVLEHWLGYERLQWLNRTLPRHWTAPSGRTVTLEYLPEKATARATLKLQELFGLAESPTIASGTPIELDLCAPNGRSVASVIDLSHFWANIYPEVRKELRGRYNKHPWPEDPLSFQATQKTNRQLRSDA